METPNLTDELKQSMQSWIDHHCDRADKMESVISAKDARIAELEKALRKVTTMYWEFLESLPENLQELKGK